MHSEIDYGRQSIRYRKINPRESEINSEWVRITTKAWKEEESLRLRLESSIR